MIMMIMVIVWGLVTSCNNDDEFVPQSSTSEYSSDFPKSESLRAPSRAEYRVAQKYIDNYSHYTYNHDIAPGFVSWWNCIAKAENAGTITIADILKLCKGSNQGVHLNNIESAYPGLKLEPFYDQGSFSAQDLFEYYMMKYLPDSQPCAVFIKNNYNGSWKKSVVTVLNYKDGYVYYQDTRTSSLGSLSLSNFVARAKDASDNNVVNVFHW